MIARSRKYARTEKVKHMHTQTERYREKELVIELPAKKDEDELNTKSLNGNNKHTLYVYPNLDREISII